MVVQHNISAMNANRYYGINNSGLSKSLEKLSSGYKINRAGDDAAGLAVSEKMRSQIAGITQGVRNAQDGISMIQTFEGALTETDSILQRMKTLADQSANGTYQDDVDRDAIQLEFDQLNDELNQIADTDFNGVIVLNGGEMADGLKEVDGKFDYANLAGQITDKKADLEKQISDLKALKPQDISTAKDADGNDVWNNVDDTKYDDAAAKGLWKDLGLDDSVANVDISFDATKNAADGTLTYAAVSGKAYDKDGNVVKELTAADLTKAGITATAATQTGATGHGGFDVKSTTNTNAFTNAIFDATAVNTGDRLTLNFTGPSASPKAPTNVGMADIYKVDGTTGGDLSTVGITGDDVKVTTNPSVTLHGDVTDAAMTETIYKALNALNGAEIDVTAAKNTATAAPFNGTAKIGGVALANNTKITLGTGADAVDLYATLNAGVFTIGTINAAGNGIETNLLEIDMGQYTNTGATDGSYKFTIAMDKAFYPDAGAAPDVNAVESTLDTSTIDAQVKALEDELAALDDPQGVSVSNAYENAAIPMTYTDHIVLQTGARSKDAVDFTFKYSTGGMGKLEANMNCSARDKGLNTANLSLRTAKDANAAIDQIDWAINKVSMVRATFGAVQNRLEHKIDNMNVTKENLTSAESRIRDTNIAEEMANFTKNQILSQASQSMLAQANSLPQGALQLLG